MSLRLNWWILKTAMAERLAYRADFAFSTLVRFLPIVTQIFLWTAVYAGTREDSLNGYSLPEMISYYLLAMVGRAFSSMPGLASGIALEVREGVVKKYLTQPIDMLGYLFVHRVAHKLVYYLIAAGPFALVFWLCRDYLPDWPGFAVFGAFLTSLALAFAIGFLIESLIGLISFWFLEISSLLFIYMMLNYFLSGHMIPLDWLPEPVTAVVVWLPFKYLAYVPAAILLGKYSPEELPGVLLTGAAWAVGLLIVNRVVFRRGVRRYGAFGG
ncbi:ABC transporter permease [Alienimonas sp. DA493]|uniref:ABC transporter permease n=1 Tax=Alienimonas sp. DA493 TaxID=3373605 RepID=UPI003754DFBB